MGFFADRKSRGLKSTDAAERCDAVNALPPSEQRQFYRLAMDDNDARVRLAAARRLREASLLESLLKHSDSAIVAIASEGLAVDAGRRLKSLSLAQGRALLDLVVDGGPLAELALQAQDEAVRQAAAERFFALNEPPIQSLVTIAVTANDEALALRAVKVVQSRSHLKQIAKKTKHAAVREAAEGRIAAQRAEQERPSVQQQHRQRLASLRPLVDEAGVLALRRDWDNCGSRLAVIVAEVQQLCADPELPADEAESEQLRRLQRAQDLFAERRQAAEAAHARCRGILAEPIDAADGAQRQRWEAALAEIEDEALRDQLAAAYPAVPRAVAPVAVEDSESVASAVETVAEPVAIDEAPLNALNERARELAAASDLRAASDAFQVLHKEWLSLVAPLPNNDPRRQPFQEAWAALKAARRQQREARDGDIAEREKLLTALIAEAEALLPRASAEGGAVLAAKRDLQQRWRDVGALPQRVVAPLRKRFQQALDAIEAGLSTWYQQRDWERFAAVAPAQELCERAAALAAEETVADDALLQAVKALQEEWKKLGPLPQARNDELWGSFRGHCDRIFERLQPWFAERDAERVVFLEEREALLNRLQVVVDDASALGLVGSPADRDHDQRRQEQVSELMEAWRAAGPVAPAQRRDLDRRWKQLLDRWFAQRRSKRAQQDAEFADNVAPKEAIIAHLQQLVRDAQAARDGMLPGRTLDEVLTKLRQARRDWRQIGFVPKAEIGRLRSSWDELNEQLEELLADRLQAERAAEEAAAEAKAQVCEELAALLEEERPDWFRDEVGTLRRRWQEAGRVPRQQLKALEQRWQELNDSFEAKARSV